MKYYIYEALIKIPGQAHKKVFHKSAFKKAWEDVLRTHTFLKEAKTKNYFPSDYDLSVDASDYYDLYDFYIPISFPVGEHENFRNAFYGMYPEILRDCSISIECFTRLGGSYTEEEAERFQRHKK